MAPPLWCRVPHHCRGPPEAGHTFLSSSFIQLSSLTLLECPDPDWWDCPASIATASHLSGGLQAETHSILPSVPLPPPCTLWMLLPTHTSWNEPFLPSPGLGSSLFPGLPNFLSPLSIYSLHKSFKNISHVISLHGLNLTNGALLDFE